MTEPRIGDLKHRMRLEHPVSVADGAGGATISYGLLAELLGALNLAHQAERLELEADRHTQNLEQTLSLLNDDVPDPLPAPAGPPPGLFGEGSP